MRAQSVVLACLSLCLFAPAASAQADRYDVEIIVFEHTDGRAVSEEAWQPAIVAPEFERAGLLETAGTAGQGLPETFEPLPTAEGRLLDSVERLEESDGYRVLRHLRWRQPALEPGKSVPVRVRAGDAVPIETPIDQLRRPVPARGNRRAEADPDAEGTNAADGTDTAGDDDGGDSATAGTGVPEGDAAAGPDDGDYAYLGPYGPRTRTVAVHPLDGTIELVVSRYLHLHVDLYHTVPVEWRTAVGRDGPAGEGENGEDGDGSAAAEAGTGGTAGPAVFPRVARDPDGRAMLSFPFRQSRRMRSGNLHYIDHPKLGVLVLVTPYEEEESSTDGDGA